MKPTVRPESAFWQSSRAVLCCNMARPVTLHTGATGGLSTRMASRELAKPIARRNWPTYQAVLARFHEFCPPALPVVVRSARVAASLLGDCGRKDRRFVIRLSNLLNEEQAVEVLIHEWAHAIAWNFEIDRCSKSPGIGPHEFQTMSHGPAWGVAYSRVWQIFQDICVALRDGQR